MKYNPYARVVVRPEPDTAPPTELPGAEPEGFGAGHELKKMAPWVWQDLATGKFAFEDETTDLIGPFETQTEAQAALDRYAEFLKGGNG